MSYNKFFIASLKRTAQNVSPLVRRKQNLLQLIADAQQELDSIQIQLDTYEAPIKEATGGYTTEDLVTRVVESTGKMDKNGKPMKNTKWVLKYPDTIVPPASENVETVEDEEYGDTAAPEEVPVID